MPIVLVILILERETEVRVGVTQRPIESVARVRGIWNGRKRIVNVDLRAVFGPFGKRLKLAGIQIDIKIRLIDLAVIRSDKTSALFIFGSERLYERATNQ